MDDVATQTDLVYDLGFLDRLDTTFYLGHDVIEFDFSVPVPIVAAPA